MALILIIIKVSQPSLCPAMGTLERDCDRFSNKVAVPCAMLLVVASSCASVFMGSMGGHGGGRFGGGYY